MSRTLDRLAHDPVIVAWEVTRACGYRCHHCRADAQPRPMPGQLSHDEAMHLVDRLGGFSGTTLVLTGGDPLLRPDLVDIARRATDRGLGVALTPSATPRVTPERLSVLAEAGLTSVAISLDGATPDSHDGMRGIPGSFARTLRILDMARGLGLRTQVNTTVTTRSAPELERIAEIVEDAGIGMWSVFFLVPVGRASADLVLDADETERVLHRLADMSERVPYRLKVTEAPSYRRVLAQRRRARVGRGARPGGGAARTGHQAGGGGGLTPPPPPVNGGRGFMFISHDGDVSPSGFLPIVAGNVRADSPVDIYRSSDLFTSLRDPSRLTGRCGACEYREACGGSRARAWAMTGDLFGDDPTCAYQPEAIQC